MPTNQKKKASLFTAIIAPQDHFRPNSVKLDSSDVQRVSMISAENALLMPNRSVKSRKRISLSDIKLQMNISYINSKNLHRKEKVLLLQSIEMEKISR